MSQGGKHPEEKDAVFTTIVGGRPPGSGTNVGAVPRGIEVLLKKASVDVEFRKLLLEKRAEAAREIDLELTQAEAAMLASIPAEQLEKIIDNTKVKPEHRNVFLGKAGKLMIAVVAGVAITVAMCPTSLGHTAVIEGIRPDRVQEMQQQTEEDVNKPASVNDNNYLNMTKGIRPDRPVK